MPGGGSVAAAAGALGTSLACMVLEFTLGKPQFSEHDSRLRDVLAQFKGVSQEFARLIGDDMRAYQAVIAARKLDPEARERASLQAIAVPMRIVELGATVAVRLAEIRAIVNPHLLGDLRAAAVLSYAAARAAGCTVRDNLPSLQDRLEAGRQEARLTSLIGQAERECNSAAGLLPKT